MRAPMRLGVIFVSLAMFGCDEAPADPTSTSSAAAERVGLLPGLAQVIAVGLWHGPASGTRLSLVPTLDTAEERTQHGEENPTKQRVLSQPLATPEGLLQALPRAAAPKLAHLDPPERSPLRCRTHADTQAHTFPATN